MPRVDFNRLWSDDEIYDLIGLAENERKAIDAIIPDYYQRKEKNETSKTSNAKD